MSIVSFCTGVAALDAAAEEVTGERTTLYAETDPYACQVLAARLPHATNLGDITRIDYATIAARHPDVRTLVAGWPCQGISHNGHRLGLDDPRSGIWRNVAQAIAALRPERVFLENVAALRTRGLSTVSAHLNELGYDLYWTITRAGDVGAAHTRPRFLGYAVPGRGITVEVPAPAPTVEAVPRLLPTPKASDGPNGGPNQRDGAGNYYLPGIAVRLDTQWRAPELGHDYGLAIRRWERILGRPAPTPTSPDRRGNLRLSPRFGEWLMGYPAGWVTDLDLPRSQQIKLCGNGVVTLQGVAGYRLLMATASPTRMLLPALPEAVAA
ncbi:DNA cytosine methyltransferase [Streptomyces sp. TRM43335]|uniref:DNA (cytosine-5-)-methyltransferase n=1 Tax=Streptomyces taklimakanensis TaxID=2569853 RepID=A0A6G2BDA8_9ACTN|nr:DNA cytosine methyltransferase [Streptomyces taklimakanensis]MTE20238.1 DNA cytosine methyltransferase [Streptomyces taklimakanensis]